MAGDQQILSADSSSAPKDYVIPQSQELLLKACFAHFDGSGAAGDYIPTLSIISDSGDTVAEIPQDSSVLAGSSVEATWGPFLRTGGTGGGPTVGYVDVAGYTVSGASVNDTGGYAHLYSFGSASTFYTTDSGIITTGSFLGVQGIAPQATGTYMYHFALEVYTGSGQVPAAGSFAILSPNHTAFNTQYGGVGSLTVLRQDFLYDPNTNRYYAYASAELLSSIQAPEVVNIEVGHNAGFTCDANIAMSVSRLTSKVF